MSPVWGWDGKGGRAGVGFKAAKSDPPKRIEMGRDEEENQMPADYSSEPEGSYASRRQDYLEYCAAQSPGGRTGFFSQIARLELGREPVDEARIREGIAFVDSRQDCCDFSVGGFLRILYLYHDSPLIAPELISDIEACLLRFKYWWDEPQGDNKRCYHTENHQIIFHSDELLAAQLFPDKVFQNSGKDAAYHIKHALHFIRRWFNFRAKFGFSEWLSNCYFEEDLLALVNLHDFAQQPDIQQQAKLCIDMILFEMAMHTYRGVMGCTHGRTYARLIKGARGEDATNTARLMFGMGMYNHPANLGTVPLATSTYRCPEALVKIAADLEKPRLFTERHSINLDDAPQFGLSYDNMEDGHLYWSIQDYVHPAVYNLAQQTRAAYGIGLYEDYQQRYDQIFQWQVKQYGGVTDRVVDCHGLTEVHIQTYRTGQYLLSCAQDFRAGKPGYQQHPWQATMGLDAVVFSNHPGSEDEQSRPNYWAGNGVLPRAAQHENVLVCIHHIPGDDAFPFSHVYFPREAFDEIVGQGNWVFGRKGEGYMGLYSQHPGRWVTDKDGKVIELRAEAADNIWLCEMGNAEQWSDFTTFVERVGGASVQADGLDISYESPSQGRVEFGWSRPLSAGGAEIGLHQYARYDNPYCRAAFGDTRYEIHVGAEEVVLDFEAAIKEVSGADIKG